MKIQNKGKFIAYIISTLCLILLINGIVKSFKYGVFYNKSPKIINEQYKDMHKALFSSKSIESNNIKSTFVLLSGNITIANIKSINDTKINMKLTTKTGKAKVLLWDDSKRIVIFKELSDDEEEISIKPGEYQVIVLGQWFTGRVTLNTKGEKLFKVN